MNYLKPSADNSHDVTSSATNPCSVLCVCLYAEFFMCMELMNMCECYIDLLYHHVLQLL